MTFHVIYHIMLFVRQKTGILLLLELIVQVLTIGHLMECPSCQEKMQWKTVLH